MKQYQNSIVFKVADEETKMDLFMEVRSFWSEQIVKWWVKWREHKQPDAEGIFKALLDVAIYNIKSVNCYLTDEGFGITTDMEWTILCDILTELHSKFSDRAEIIVNFVRMTPKEESVEVSKYEIDSAEKWAEFLAAGDTIKLED